MPDTGANIIERGTTFYGSVNAVPSTYVQSTGLEGRQHVSPDMDPSNAQVRRSQNDVRSIIVRNVSPFTIYAGQTVLWATGYRGKRVAGKCFADYEEVAGVVDDQLGSSGCREGDLFNLIVQGPCSVLLSRTAAEAVIGAGDLVYAVSAATSGATTAGRFTDWIGTFTLTETTDGTAASIVMNRLGRAISAATTADTGALRLVDLNIQT